MNIFNQELKAQQLALSGGVLFVNYEGATLKVDLLIFTAYLCL